MKVIPQNQGAAIANNWILITAIFQSLNFYFTINYTLFLMKVKLTDEEIPLADDTGAAQLTLLGCDPATLDARKSLRRFFPSIISCIRATASVAKAYS